MKTTVASLISLVLGLGLGWYFESHRAQRDKTEIVGQLVEGGESADRERAMRAVRAIESIQAGDTQKAVQLLSSPVAHYYTLYTEPGTKEEKRAETRAAIELLAKTNQIVAARISEFSSNLQVRIP
jgi:hypothetical protein